MGLLKDNEGNLMVITSREDAYYTIAERMGSEIVDFLREDDLNAEDLELERDEANEDSARQYEYFRDVLVDILEIADNLKKILNDTDKRLNRKTLLKNTEAILDAINCAI